MNIQNRITKYTILPENDSLSSFDGYPCQQAHQVYELFYNFLNEVKPKRILEIGTASGGFTKFLKIVSDENNLNIDIRSYDITELSFYDELIKDGVDVRVENIFLENYSDVPQDIKDFIRKEGVTVVLCDGGSNINEFNLLSKFIKPGDFIMAHDYAYDYSHFKEKIEGVVWNWFEIQEDNITSSCIENNLKPYKRDEFSKAAWVCKVKEKTKKITLVTGLWDIGRDSLEDGWSRSFDHYLENFKKYLQIPHNLIIFGDSNLQSFVEQNKTHNNIQFVNRNLDWFKNSFYDKIQKIRNNREWSNQKGWLSESTQARLEMYNPLVMQKMFLLNDAKIIDSFDSDLIFWLDAGITNTVHSGYFTHDLVFNKIDKFVNKFSFICFPYEADGEIHGFNFDEMCRISGKKVQKVARGGFFGGPVDTIQEAMGVYYGLTEDTLTRGFMGTEESIFSIMVYKYPQQFDYFEIESNGLLGKFFEDLKNQDLKVKSETTIIEKNKNMDLNKTSLYVITFNSPDQLESLIESFYKYDPNFIEKPKKYLLNNSTDRSTDWLYDQLCEEFEFEQLRFPQNLGICGGRQYIAEHFDKSDSDFMFFFEDDMFFYQGENIPCRNGFNRYVKNIYLNSLEITKNEGFDFLKLNFSEFYGDNSTQWAWYNVPQDVRNERWPEYNRLPERGLDPNAPKTKFGEIKSYKGIPYATGEIYYCNWPQIVTKTGNKKMFIDTVWAHPHEQTWMSHIYQQTIQGNIDPGILLISPIDHNRFDHYEGTLRKES